MAKEENVGWKMTLGMISSGENQPQALGMQADKTQRRSRGWGAFPRAAPQAPVPPRSWRAAALLQSHFQLRLCPALSGVPGRGEQSPPFSLWFKQQGWELEGSSTSFKCQVFVFLRFQPRVRWGRGSSRARGLLQRCCSVEGVFAGVWSDRCQGDAF